MKSIKQSSNQMIKYSKKNFAGWSHKEIDKNLREFDIAFVGGL